MNDIPLPTELAEQWARNADIRYRGNDEWSSACPYCNPGGRGGRDPSDRFRMFSTGGPPRGWCRSCDRKVMAKSADGHMITKEEKEAARAKYFEWLQVENKRLRDKIKWLQDQGFWRRWHDTMNETAKEMWRRHGIEDSMANIHHLGYTMERYPDCGGALTVPYMHHDEIQTLQYRLMIPPNGDDKYRFEQGTKAAWFYPWPDDEIGDVVLVVEGAKKAMVVWQTIAKSHALTFRGHDVTVIGSPSKHVPNKMLEQLDNTKMVIWLLDPDAYVAPDKGVSAMLRNAQAVGVEKSRQILTVDKIDDMILAHDGINGKRIQNMVNQASPVIVPNANRKASTRYL